MFGSVPNQVVGLGIGAASGKPWIPACAGIDDGPAWATLVDEMGDALTLTLSIKGEGEF